MTNLASAHALKDAKNKNSKHELMIAANNNDRKTFHRLLTSILNKDKAADDPDILDLALLETARGNYLDDAKEIIDKTQVDVNKPNLEGENALTLAAYLGHEEYVKWLLTLPQIDVNACNELKGCALFRAAYKNYPGIVKALLQNEKIDINAVNRDGSTTLAVASQTGWEEIAKELVLCPDIDVNLPDRNGNTPLMLAAASSLSNMIVKYLMAHPKIEINKVNAAGQTALMAAARGGIRENIVELMKSADVDIYIKDNTGMTAPEIAGHAGHVGAASLLEKLAGKQGDVPPVKTAVHQ